MCFERTQRPGTSELGGSVSERVGQRSVEGELGKTTDD